MEAIWKFLKWFFEEGVGNVSFGKNINNIVKKFDISRGMAFNIISEMVMATVIALFSIGALILKSPDMSLKGIMLLLGFSILCVLFVATEKLWG